MKRNELFEKIRRCPVEFLLVASCAAGILAITEAWYFALLILPLFLFPKQNILAAGAVFLLSLASAYWQIPRSAPDAFYGTAILRITDLRISTVEGLTPPSMLQAEILQFQPQGGEMTGLREKSFVRLAGTLELTPETGAVYRASGSFSAPENTGFLRYLHARKVRRTFFADAIEKTAPAGTWRKTAAACRDRILERVLAHVDDPGIRTGIASLFFNAGGGLTRENRSQFLRSGTIHVFSVSGMHVGMLAALLFLLLRFLPSKWREGTVLVILTLYVLLAGAAPPSVRALGMIGIFLLLRMILLQADPLRVLALIAVFLLLVTPGLLYDIGFLYSFIITAALLAAARMFADVNKLIHAPVLLMQRSKDRRNLYNRTRPAAVMLSALGVTMTSFLAGMAISVRSRGLFLPGSIAANLLLLPLIPILFILLGAKIVIGWIHPAADRCAAFLLTAGFRVLDAVTAFVAGFFDALPVCRPSMGEIILFYAGLLIFLTARKMKFRLAALGIAFLLMLLWVLLPLSASPFLAVLSSDAATPVMVIEADPGRNRAVVHNAPSADAAYAAADLLIRSGITRIEVLRLEKARKGYCRGAMALASQLPVCRLEIPQPCRKPLLTFLQTGFPPEKLQSLFSPAPEITIQNTPAGRKIIIGTKEYFQPYSNQTKTIVHQDP